MIGLSHFFLHSLRAYIHSLHYVLYFDLNYALTCGRSVCAILLGECVCPRAHSIE